MQIEFERTFRRSRGIPMVALVDVLCVLLIFFMLSTSFVRTEAMELTLPSQAGAAQGEAGIVHIFITNNGETFLESRSVGENELRHGLRERLFDKPESHVLVLVADKVSVQTLVRVLDRVYLSGGRNIAVDNWRIG